MFFIITCFFSTLKLALIRLPEKVQFSETIRPVQMPTVCKTLENIVVLAVGDGATGRDTISNRLKFAVLKTLSFKNCRKAFPFLKKRESILCAHNDVNYQTISTGDFGGPLISSVDNTLIGISSFLGKNVFFFRSKLNSYLMFGNICACKIGGQGVKTLQGFTNVHSHLNWIKEVTGLNLPSC